MMRSDSLFKLLGTWYKGVLNSDNSYSPPVFQVLQEEIDILAYGAVSYSSNYINDGTGLVKVDSSAGEIKIMINVQESGIYSYAIICDANEIDGLPTYSINDSDVVFDRSVTLKDEIILEGKHLIQSTYNQITLEEGLQELTLSSSPEMGERVVAIRMRAL